MIMFSGKKKKLITTIIILIAAAVAWFSQQDFDKPSVTEGGSTAVNGCSVHYVDVGQGDCELIECGGKYLLIDAGENGHETEVINYIRNLGIEKLDYVIATHQHSDHIGGLVEVLEEFETDTIIMPRLTEEQTPSNSTYRAFLKAVQASGAQVIAAEPGDEYALGEATFEILGPVTDDAEDINNMSAVTKLTYGENSFIFTGDAEAEEEREIIENGADLGCDVLKVGHHGSYTSSCEEWLDAVNPEICVISCGEDNEYGHPHDKVVDRLYEYTDKIYRTDVCGNIVITSDGENLNVEYDYEVK